MKVCALTCTSGRHGCLERSVSFFLQQSYPDSVMLIYNNSGSTQKLSDELKATGRIILVNNHIDLETDLPYTNVGAIFRDAVTFIPEDVDLVAIWDDDDIYLPNHLEEGVAGFLEGELLTGKKIQAYKPAKSYYYHDNMIELTSNTLEPSFFVTPNSLRYLGFIADDVKYHDGWRKRLEAEGTLYIKENGVSTMIYDWSGTTNVHKISGDPDNTRNFENHRLSSRDEGDGIIAPVPNPYSFLELVSTPQTRLLDKTKTLYPEYFWGKNVLIAVGDDWISSGGYTHLEKCNVRTTRDLSSRDLIYRDYDIVIANQYTLDLHFLYLKPGGLLLSIAVSEQNLFNESIPSQFFVGITKVDDTSFILQKTFGDTPLDLKNPSTDFVFMTAQPDDLNWCWETRVQLTNLRSYKLSHLMKILVYWEPSESKKAPNPCWQQLQEEFHEAEIFYVANDGSELPYRIVYGIYTSVIRPFCMKKYWLLHPEMEQKTIFYMDSDVIFTKKPDITAMLAGKECYGTDVGHYLNAAYMQAKAREANLPDEHFSELVAKIVDVPKSVVMDNNDNCGGAQYVFKGVTYEFWDKVQQDCILIKHNFHLENLRYFVQRGIKLGISTEDAGIQSWCADMWAVWLNLYYFGKTMTTPDFMHSVWCSDTIERLEANPQTCILHNAGIGDHNRHEAFDKTKFRKGREYGEVFPWDTPLDHVNPQLCSWIYTEWIKKSAPKVATVKD